MGIVGLFAAALLAPQALGQPVGFALTASQPEAQQPGVDQPPADPTQILSRAQEVAAQSLRAEHWRLRVEGDAAQPATDVWFWFDPGAPSQGRPRRLRLDLERLTIFCEGDRLLATHAGNPLQYEEVSLADGLSAGSLRRAIPHVPLPTLWWALSDGSFLPGWDPARWRTDGDAIVRDDDARARFDGGGALTFFQLPLSAEPGTLLIGERTAVRTPAPNEAWSPSIVGRERVERLQDLRPFAGDVKPGDRVPALGLLDDQLDGWSLPDALKARAAEDPQPAGTTAAALFILPDNPRAITPSLAKAVARADAIRAEFEQRARRGTLGVARLMVVVVVLSDEPAIGRERVTAMTNALAEAGAPKVRTLWSLDGSAWLARTLPRTTTGLVIVDDEQRLLAGVRLDEGGASLAESVEREIRAVVTDIPRVSDPAAPAPK